MGLRIDASERNILLGLSAFAVLWIVVILPFLQSSTAYQSSIPPIQYLLYNLGFITLLSTTVGGFLSMQNHRYDIGKAFTTGLSIWLSFSFVADLWQPPFAIDAQGNDIISDSGNTFINSAADRMWVYIINIVFPWVKSISIPFLNISLLFISVYLIVPILTLILAAYLLSNGQFFKWATRSDVYG